MKKQTVKMWIWLAAAILVFAGALILPALLRGGNGYAFQQDRSNVAGVDIVYVKDLSHLTTGYYEGAAETVSVIDEASWDSLFKRFDELRVKTASHPPREELSGQLIRVTYEDGAFEIIGPYMYYYRDAKGQQSYDCHAIDREEFEDLVNSFKN